MIIKTIETEEEIIGMAYVHFKSWEETYMNILGSDFFKNRSFEQQLERTRKSLESGDLALIAIQDNKIVGFITYGQSKDKDLDNCGEIYALYVLKDYQHQGIGSSLIKRALDDLRGFNGVFLWVFKDNKNAFAFYKRFGFEEDGKTKITKIGKIVEGKRLIRK